MLNERDHFSMVFRSFFVRHKGYMFARTSMFCDFYEYLLIRSFIRNTLGV